MARWGCVKQLWRIIKICWLCYMKGKNMAVYYVHHLMKHSRRYGEFENTIWKPQVCIINFTIYGYVTNSQGDQVPVGLMTQLVGHCTFCCCCCCCFPSYFTAAYQVVCFKLQWSSMSLQYNIPTFLSCLYKASKDAYHFLLLNYY